MRLRRGQVRRTTAILAVVVGAIFLYHVQYQRISRVLKTFSDFASPRQGNGGQKRPHLLPPNAKHRNGIESGKIYRNDAIGRMLSEARTELHHVKSMAQVTVDNSLNKHKAKWGRRKRDIIKKLKRDISEHVKEKRSWNTRSKARIPAQTPAPSPAPTANCNKPVVMWDTPMAGGNVNGFASEAISLLYPLSDILDIRLYSTYYEEDFVESLPHNVGERIHELHMKSTNRSLPPPDVIVSQWSPPELVQHMWNWLVSKRRPVRYVSRTMFEADGLPTGWEAAIDKIDEVWVPSEWNKDVFAARGIDQHKLRVLHEGVDTETYFNPDMFNRRQCRAKLLHKTERRTFVFLSVFKFETRKAWRELVSAFLDEFDEEDPVTLLLRTSPGDNMHLWKDFENEACALRELPPHCFTPHAPTALRSVRLLPRMSTKSYPHMYKAADAFVLPSHGEGWGRPILEAMAMALPVITTNWSGPTEYIRASNAYPLPVTAFEPCEMEPQLQWATINASALQALLRAVYTDAAVRAERGQRARQTVQHAYRNNNVTHEVLGMLQSACWHAQRDYARRHPTTTSEGTAIGGNAAKAVLPDPPNGADLRLAEKVQL
eukprot:m.503488 g.503488  ORF g.503488 m.503488 type:complete len:602 (+) comp21848_c0_seq2:461-2266(+)